MNQVYVDQGLPFEKLHRNEVASLEFAYIDASNCQEPESIAAPQKHYSDVRACAMWVKARSAHPHMAKLRTLEQFR
jgi:hypothetical protein